MCAKCLRGKLAVPKGASAVVFAIRNTQDGWLAKRLKVRFRAIAVGDGGGGGGGEGAAGGEEPPFDSFWRFADYWSRPDGRRHQQADVSGEDKVARSGKDREWIRQLLWALALVMAAAAALAADLLYVQYVPVGVYF